MGNRVLIEARDLAYSYEGGSETVFTGASFPVYAGDKAALLGDNGSGKTTLLRLLAGELEPAGGRLLNRGASVYLLRQEDAAPGGVSAEAWLLEACGESGWEGLPRIAAAAAALGFAPAELRRPVESFSGGERKMLAITAGLLRAPDLYLLDEPTNYLDGAAIRRLAGALRAYKGGFIVVSHDRAFLDSCVSKVLELKRSCFFVYAGDYTSYAAQKEAEYNGALSRKKKIEREIEGLREAERNYRDWGASKEKEKRGAFDKGFIGARAARLQKKSARAAQRAREKIEELEREKPFVEKRRHITLPAAGDAWLEARGLTAAAGSRTLFRDISFHLKAGERLCLEGDNGAGKSTLMRLLAGETPAGGEVLRARSARVFYMPQFRAPAPPGLRGADYFHGALRQAGCTMLDHLGADGELMFRPLGELSEGQRRKVELARFLVNGADIAMLDEPTTHQDMRSVRVLEEALAGYAGVLVLISHDAAFRAALPGRTLRLGQPGPGGIW